MVSSLKVVLNKCRTSSDMENCEDFIRLQDLCETTNDYVKDFSKISFRGGMVDVIQVMSLFTHISLRRS